MPGKRYRMLKLQARLHYSVSFAFFIFICFILMSSSFAGDAEIKMFRETLRSYTNVGTRAVTGADLDSDGDIDLVTANIKTSNLNVFLNNGQGGFSGGSRYGVQNGPLVMGAGDLDNDGDVDLAVLCFSASQISILLNRGTASFAVTAAYTITGSPSDMCIGDFNNDGNIDLITANSNSGDLAILLNEGGAKFGEPQRIDLPGNPYDIICGDFNNDGKGDIVAASSQKLCVLLNSGGSVPFSAHTDYDMEKRIHYLSTGDLNGDGKIDLATLDIDSEIWIFLNKGKGVLEQQKSYKAGESSQAFAIMDVDRDSMLDLVVANKKSKDLSVFLNTGNGDFGEEIRHELRAAPSAIYAAHFNSDDEGTDLALVVDDSMLSVVMNIYEEK
jgi:VCBS repeat protein